ncbi:Cys-tRNA(Pro) deacylase [Nocardioides coralli]|uniref:Cys-tRNA(Pro) deacylase n=1 Tax=Nocardioides coralli TaxID=2872154 RepID=UPI001CA41395|nr:Cys-tRNA(Pro) deacylase [Nocardioides coralli]QZY27942.1 Cys-tRNA(Pro) deacylase [Nocardioides coralli]
MAKRRTGGTPATVALDRAGVDYRLLPYEHDPRAESYGLEAAEALGVDPARVLKTLVTALDPRPGARARLVVGIVPVSTLLDLKALARAVGAPRAAMADVAEAERATGYVAGGISPIGQRRQLATVVDRSALDHPRVLVSAGRRGLDVELTPADLLAVTGGTVAEIGRASS